MTTLPTGYALSHGFHEGEDPDGEPDALGLLPRRYITVSDRTGDPVGQLDYVYNPQTRLVTLVGDMWVDPQHRRKGLGTAMVKHLTEVHPGASVDPNGFTNEGLDFWRTLTQG